jgi:DNA-binding beta-propeller fold protein YncE
MLSIRRGVIGLLLTVCSLCAATNAASAREVLYGTGSEGDGGSPSTLYTLDRANGSALQAIGPVGFAVTGLAVDPADGTLYATTGRATAGGAPNPGSLITIDRTTGAGTLVGDLRPDTETAGDITFTPDGALFGWLQPTSNDLATIDKSTGAASIVGNSGITTVGSGLASSPDGVLYHAALDDGPLWTINRATGAATVVADLNGTESLQIPGLSFDAAGTLFGAWLDYGSTGPRPSRLLTIDTFTGALTFLGPSVNRLDAIAFVEVQSTRTVTLAVAKVRPKTESSAPRLKVKKGKKVIFSGNVSAPDDATGCAAGQTLRLERKRPRESSFTGFAEAQTDASGRFSTTQKIKKTYQYRASLVETDACSNALSLTEKVKVKKRKKKTAPR